MARSEVVPEVLATVRRMAASGRAREIRLAARVPLATVADAVGVTPSAVLRWETGERQVATRNAVRYGQVLTDLVEVVLTTA